MKKTKNKHGLSDEQVAWSRHIIADPVLFATHILGADLWDREVEILRSIQLRRRTAIKACHGVGKTFTLALAVLWWLARHREGIVLTTSPTERQVKTQVWVEIRRAVQRSKISFPEIRSKDVKLRGDDNFAMGLSTNQAENFQGYHGRHVLIIADEAPGITPALWDAIAGTMAGGEVHVVMAGNPTMPSGAFFDAFNGERTLWNCITIGAFETPNLKGTSLEKLLEMDSAEGGPLDDNRIPYLVTKRGVYDQYFAWYHGDESSSPNWLSRVLARFPDQAQDALIKLGWLDRAREGAASSPVVDRGTSRVVAGVDVGAGEGETVVYLCDTKPNRHKIIKMGAWRSEDTRGEVVRFLNPYRNRLSTVRVDATGIGHNFALHLRSEGFPVELIHVGLPCESPPDLGDNDPALRFVNQKAQFYQNLADVLERNQIDGLTDEVTLSQLAGLLYEIDAHGRLKIESKDKARSRGVRSPDRAEALMLALGKPHVRLPDYMLMELAGAYRRRQHMTVEQIADKLGASTDEVHAWEREYARREREAMGISRKICALCSGEIEFGTPFTRQRDLHYHEACGRKAIFGPFAA